MLVDKEQLSQQQNILQLELQQFETERSALKHTSSTHERQLEEKEMELQSRLNEIAKQELKLQTHLKRAEAYEQQYEALKTVQEELQVKERSMQSAMDDLAKVREEKNKNEESFQEHIKLLQKQMKVFKRWGLSPKRHVFVEFLQACKQLFSTNPNQPRPKCFISYAWELDSKANKVLQEQLFQMQEDLQVTGIQVFLDIVDMHGRMKNQMRKNIEQSDYIFLIGTPRLIERLTDSNSSLAYEYHLILEKQKENPEVLIPLLLEGDYKTSFPAAIQETLIRDVRDQEKYFHQMATPLQGIIPRIYGMRNDNDAYNTLFKSLNRGLKKIYRKEKALGAIF
jgi:TIR domain